MISLIAPLLAPLIAIPDYSALARFPLLEERAAYSVPQPASDASSAMCPLPSAMGDVVPSEKAAAVSAMAEPASFAPGLRILTRTRPAEETRFATQRTSEQPGPGHLELWREADGLFYVTASINGQPVRFLVDTGASMIVLTAEDARRIGAAVQPGASQIRTETANGDRSMSRIMLASMQVGATNAAAVPAAVAGDGLRVSLLGQNWLSHIRSVTIDGDRMVLQ